jgi:alpha-tubulin suppressor-like RCC1 family protein
LCGAWAGASVIRHVKPGIPERRFLRRCGVVALIGLLAGVVALVAVPKASSEQAASQLRRLPAGFLDAGQAHTCAVLDTGAVRCWGIGLNGVLGYGNTNPIGDNETPASASPVFLGAGRRAVAISAGTWHTCALLDNGRVRCWGASTYGQLGYANTSTIGDDETPGGFGPVDLGVGRRAVAISAGTWHTCAIVDTGAVHCWGYGASGRLGYGNTSHVGDDETPGSVGPVDLGVGRRALAISAGDHHTCAVLDTGAVRCWGLGSFGRLGYGNTDSIGDGETPGSVGPVFLGVGRRAVAISAGADHTCALLDTGAVRCWGYGLFGQLGYGNMDSIGDTETPGSVGPVVLGAGRRAVAIGAGGKHTCALLDTGAVRCWGWGGYGQLGYGNKDSIGNDETPGGFGPVDLGAGRSAVAISAGGDHTCAILDNSRVRCWGYSANGELGYGNMNDIGDDETPGSVNPVDAGGLVATKVRPTLSLALAPKRDRAAPYRLRASGKLSGFLADPATCAGTVKVTAKKGKKAVAKRPALKLGTGGCTYAASFKVRGAGTWKVTASFAGNGSLRARSAQARPFRAG